MSRPSNIAPIQLDVEVGYDTLHTPILVPGFAAYCPVCGIGHDTAKEAEKCCAVLGDPSRRRTRPKWERTRV